MNKLLPAPRAWYLMGCLTVLGLAVTATFQSSAERAFATQTDLIPIDFPVFYLGGKVALQKGAAQLYYPPAPGQGFTLLYRFADPATEWAQMARANGFPQALQFTNPPFSAVLMAPLAIMPWRWAYLIWQCIIVVLTAATIFLTLKLAFSDAPMELLAVIFAAACFFYPFTSTLVFGQVNVSILFLWALGVYLLDRQRPVASGACFALGTVLKIAPVVAVPLLLIRRQWKWLAAYVLGVGAFTGISVWILGWQNHVTWLTAIYPSISSGAGTVSNLSLAGLINLLGSPRYFITQYANTAWPVPHALGLFEKACSVAIGLGFIYWCWRRRRDAGGLVDELILLPLVYLLAAPFSWPHHFALAILPLSYSWARGHEATSQELAALCLGTLALGSELPMYIARFSPWAGPCLVIVATAIWPAATCAIFWAGMRMYLRAKPL